MICLAKQFPCSSSESNTIKIAEQSFFLKLNQSDSFFKEDESQVRTIVFNKKSDDNETLIDEEIPGTMKVIASGFTALAVTGFVVIKGIRSVFWS